MSKEFEPGMGDSAPSPQTHRISDTELNVALVKYRNDVNNPVQRVCFALALDAAVSAASKGHGWRIPALASHVDDLAHMTWKRLLIQEEKQGQLLSDYNPGMENGRSVYSWVWQNCRYAALDLLEGINAPKASGISEISLSEFDPDDEAAGAGSSHRGTPPELQVTETPLRASKLRVATLTPWLACLADEMIGQEVAIPPKGSGTYTRHITLDQNHRRIWLAWLALGNTDLIDASEARLEKIIGTPKTNIQRHTDEAFHYMLRHTDFPRYLDLMIPNRVRGYGVSNEQLRAALLECLHGPKGKVAFRSLVHAWIETYAS